MLTSASSIQFDPQLRSKKLQTFLHLIKDFLHDESIACSLGEALKNQEALDVMRMLSHQWYCGLSTLSGDHHREHGRHLTVSAGNQFMSALESALDKDEMMVNDLFANLSRAEISDEIQKNLSRNRPVQAAWYAALLWERKSDLLIVEPEEDRFDREKTSH